MKFLQKIFGTKQEREIRRMSPIVEEVNDILIALHNYNSHSNEPLPITHMVKMDVEEIKKQAKEFERRWAELVATLSPEAPDYTEKLREAENKAAQWFLEGDKGEPAELDWRVIYWGIESEIRGKDKWAGVGDDWICLHLREKVGRPMFKELSAELESKEKGALKAWLSAKKELQKRIHPALVARTRAFQKRLSEQVADIEEQAKKVDETEIKEFWKTKTNDILEPIIVEVFAMVREACYLRLGDIWSVRGYETTWDMFPFNVQVIGGIVLHEGRIAEMRTGEGKTLVATMPLFLNALAGRGAHLVTVNDYLATRDKEWMAPIYEYLGLTVGVIQEGMTPAERQPEYACDITYGTNNQFGFDYLRDNMVHSIKHKVQRVHAYAIVDEVDSVLIDESRTPLIISGPTEYVDRGYQRYKSGVDKLFRAQQRLSTERVAKAEELIKEGDIAEAARLLLMVKRSTPKNKKLLRLLKEGSTMRDVETVENSLMREKKIHELDAENYFTYDEHMRAVELNEKGRELLNPRDPDAFTLPDLSTGLDAIEKRSDLAPKQKLKEKEELYHEYARKSEMLNNHHALLKAYVLFNKDEDYIIADGKVIIVDPFTGRPQPGRRYSDGLHEALEAKENVRVQEETQTVASITHQNYFRMYAKLAGMTGTALTEASEFWNIYKLEVIEIPTNKPIRRIDYPDVVYATRNEKYRAVIDEAEKLHKKGHPILIGTTSVEVSETLGRLLRRRGINHNVLNAKHHQKEAEIVREAGQLHKVTIATNMAGRGTDIKLDPRVMEIETTCNIHDTKDEIEVEKIARSKGCQEDYPRGLIILGTERHESRRIDNQLRGRSGRQGDPGASRFFLSLEDKLLRIFGADRMQQVIEKFSKNEMEPISTPLITRAIQNAQKRVEQNNFEMRKRLLEYDDVLNKQREEIYATRNEILSGDDLNGLCRFIYSEVIERIVSEHCGARGMEECNWEAIEMDFVNYFMFSPNLPSPDEKIKRQELIEHLNKRADEAFDARKELLGEKFNELQNLVLLTVIDRHWRDHLREMDELKKGIGLRSVGGKDPIVEYKREAYGKYEEMVISFQKDVTKLLFRAQLKQAPVRRQAPVRAYKEDAPSAIPGAANNNAQVAQSMAKARPATVKNKVGRNDPCPCGSGKKYKKCCYPKYG